uniref:Uncharacterized protein n=2 Tax=Caenorhabditis japonica TaxID=281687 RepID=A0A8R1IXN9_CAEJA
MTSTTKFVIEHELEDENGQDGGHKNGFIDDKILDVEMDCESLEREHEARTREDEARLNVIEQDLRKYENVAPNVAKRMIETIRERFSQREKLIRNTFLDDGSAIKSERLRKESGERKVARYEQNCFHDTEDGSPRRHMQGGSRGTYWPRDENVERIERTRGYYQETEQSFGEVKNRWNLQESGRYRERSSPFQTELSMLSQLYLEQNLPEPPKYTAEEDSV